MNAVQPFRSQGTHAEKRSQNAGVPAANPHSLRDKIFKSLPKYSGPYPVGMMDIEIPVESPRVFSDITRHKRHLLQLETVLFSIYYPAAFGTGIGKDPTGRDSWSRETWLPRPRDEIARGYGQFAGIPKVLSMAWFFSSTWFTKLPAFRNAQLASHYSPENYHNPTKASNNQAGEPPPGEPPSPVFPLVVFSHGLGGTRTTSSTLCGEFASFGFVVVAMEHRDGSSARTFVNHPKESELATSVIDHLEEDLKRGYDRVDYIFPQSNIFHFTDPVY
jgi:platelet-activating factor acetylhydrolase